MPTKTRSLMFKDPLVRAILGGTKTQTRRLVKEVPRKGNHFGQLTGDDAPPVAFDSETSRIVAKHFSQFTPYARPAGHITCPYGQPGDRLWVKECYAYRVNEDQHPVDKRGQLVSLEDAEVLYRSDYYRGDYGLWTRDKPKRLFEGPWRPSMFMPRTASRILLQITDVRVQRLNDISEKDAEAEGVAYDQGWEEEPGYGYLDYSKKEEDYACLTAKASFKTLWDSINGKTEGSNWKANPWVWALTFKRIK